MTIIRTDSSRQALKQPNALGQSNTRLIALSKTCSKSVSGSALHPIDQVQLDRMAEYSTFPVHQPELSFLPETEVHVQMAPNGTVHA